MKYILLLLIPSVLQAQQIKNIGYDLTPYSTNYYSIPFVDLDDDATRQVIVDQEVNQYLGHPTTVLLKDGKNMFCVYPKGHGRGAIVMKKSEDGGLTWSKRLKTPNSWSSSLEVPTIFSVEDASGKERLILFSGLYPVRMAISEDEGNTWSELKILGDWGGIVVMGDLIQLNTGKGHYMAMFHDDGRFFSKDGRSTEEQIEGQHNRPMFTLYKTFSYDGGLTWSQPKAVWQGRTIHLCEPGFVRSPDGKQIAVLLRENSRRMNSHII
ncbi:MAG: sialidase family protein, partial [Bacteroidota bacterium]